MSLPWLVRQWILNAARQRAQQTLFKSVQEQLRGTAATDSASLELARCDVAVLFALETESGSLEDRLEQVVRVRGDGFQLRYGRLNDRAVVVVRCGAGEAKAVHAATAILDAHRPGWLISAGFAGGLREGIKSGDLLLADGLVNLEGHRMRIDLEWTADELWQTRGLHRGRLLTSDRIICAPGDKRALGQRYDAVAVDMESFAVADLCCQRPTRFLAVRAIHDAVDDRLPADVEHLVKQQSLAGRIGAAMGTVARRPASVKDLWGLNKVATGARERLADFLERLVTGLVPAAAQENSSADLDGAERMRNVKRKV